MPYASSLSELEETYQTLRLKLDDMDQQAIRDKRGDFRIIPLEQLQETFQTNIPPKKKAELILTEIGYLRCNLFSEYYERIKRAEKAKELDEAVALMAEYAEIAFPFVSTKQHSLFILRMKGLLLQGKEVKEVDQKENWKTHYEAWLRRPKRAGPTNNCQTQIEEFAQLLQAFLILYTYSFSVDNFPPLRNRRSDRLL